MARTPIEVDAATLPPLGMTPEQFLSRYWQKRPLLVRNAFPGFTTPIEPEDLAGLACEEAALSRIVVHHRQADRYELRTGPFPEEMFPDMPHQDWTLLVQDVDKWDLDVAALIQAFDFLPRWRIDDIMVSFAAPGGSVGPHVDQYDVFLLQAKGRRRWQIDAGANPPVDFREDSELKLLKEFQPTHEWILEEGDMLYLPPGVPHHGEAVDACLTFSLGMRAPSAAELVVELADHVAERLPEELRYADPDLAPARDAHEIDAAAIGRLRTALGSLGELDDAQLRDFFGSFITRYRSAGQIPGPARAPTRGDVEARLEKGALIARHPFVRLAWARDGRGARLFVEGDAWRMGIASARALCADGRLDAGDYGALDEDGRQAVIDLLGRGIMKLGPVPRRRQR
ncbi:JmjC domain-containing protein [Alkalisalibacterium limincola]